MLQRLLMISGLILVWLFIIAAALSLYTDYIAPR
jgi:hypothetical protein